jgi:hypothetical protein
VFIVANRSDTCGLRPQRRWEAEKGPWSREQFEGLLQAESRLSIPAGRSGGISDGVSSRVHRLRVLGNSIVPQAAEHIGRRIVAANNG